MPPKQAGGRPAGQQPKEGTTLADTIRSIAQGLAFFFLINIVVTKFFSKPQAPVVPAYEAATTTAGIHEGYNSVPQNVAPMWPTNSSLDVRIYVSSSAAMPAFSRVPADSLILDEKDFRLGNWEDKRTIDTHIRLPKEAQHNSTLWAHIFVAQHGAELDPTRPGYSIKTAYHFFRPLNHVLPKKKVVKTRKLLGGDEVEGTAQVEEPRAEDDESGKPKAVFASYYHPNFTMSFVPDTGIMAWPRLHPAVRQSVVLEATGARDTSGQNGWYYPVLFVNTFWQLRDHMTELNDTVSTVPLHIDLNNLKNWKFTLYASVDDNVKQTARNAASGGPVGAGGDGSEFEEFKRILIDTNIYLLSTTAVVSVLHMIFEMLAFKNDVSHWRKKKDNVGVSVRTILANVFMQTTIFLYLMDNSDGTSWMILFGQGMSILLEAWKITKTVDVRVRPSEPGSMLPYSIVFEDKHKLSETEKKTQEYDEIAFRYLYIVAVPLLLAYAAYSVMYETHKGWYSFILTTLVGSVYAYGFLMMVPSLYINYRLKSVAHMPAKAMTYKFLNTFIDDLFAFTIKMPTLHRLATLRDDVIFFVYLYQSYKYRVDYSRVNEFGQGGEDDEGEEKETIEDKLANKPLSATPNAKETDSSSAAGGINNAAELKAGAAAKVTGAEASTDGEGRKRK